MGRRTTLVLALVLLVLAAGCGDDDDGGEVDAGDDDSSAEEVAFDDLVGRTYLTTEATGHEVVAGSEINLTFIDGRISAVAGCNTQNGDADVVDGTLEVNQLASTMMGCEDDLMAQDRWLAGFLESGPTVALADGVLTLTSGEESLTLTEQEV